ncbi:hypothetical protein IAD21_04975 [Abditibacteriota bacterium]|nr:hypothetical protein IAD21_04975 [Abditibacteriota bacterium]
MPPKEELFRPFETSFEFKVKAETQLIEWKNTEGGLTFRPRGAASDFIWFIPEFWFAEEPYRHKSELGYNRHLIGFYEHKQFFRLIASKHNALAGESWLVLRPDACGIICGTYPQRANWKANLNWDEGNTQFLSAPLDVIQRQAALAIENEPIEWQRVCEWAQLGNDERFWSVVFWQCGDPQQWKNLMHAAIQIASVGDEVAKEHTWGIFVLEKPRFAFAPLRMGRGRNNHPTPLRLAPLLELLEKHFRPRIDYSRSGCRWKPPFYSVLRPTPIRGAKPSAHELMASLDVWREFGRKSGQLPQVETCLRQLLT